MRARFEISHLAVHFIVPLIVLLLASASWASPVRRADDITQLTQLFSGLSVSLTVEVDCAIQDRSHLTQIPTSQQNVVYGHIEQALERMGKLIDRNFNVVRKNPGSAMYEESMDKVVHFMVTFKLPRENYQLVGLIEREGDGYPTQLIHKATQKIMYQELEGQYVSPLRGPVLDNAVF